MLCVIGYILLLSVDKVFFDSHAILAGDAAKIERIAQASGELRRSIKALTNNEAGATREVENQLKRSIQGNQDSGDQQPKAEIALENEHTELLVRRSMTG